MHRTAWHQPFTDAVCSDSRYVRTLSAITRPNCFNGLDLKSGKYRDGTNWTQMLAGFYVSELQEMRGLRRKNSYCMEKLGALHTSGGCRSAPPPCNSSPPLTWIVSDVSLPSHYR